MIIPFRRNLCTFVEVNPDEAGLIDLLIEGTRYAKREQPLEAYRDHLTLCEEVERLVRTGIHPETRVISIVYRPPETDGGDYLAEVLGIPVGSSNHTRWNINIRVMQ